MIFLSLLMNLMLMFSTGVGLNMVTPNAVLDPQISGEHRTHGHLPGPPDGHNGDSHLHHGQHGHSVGPSGGGDHLPPGHTNT